MSFEEFSLLVRDTVALLSESLEAQKERVQGKGVPKKAPPPPPAAVEEPKEKPVKPILSAMEETLASFSVKLLPKPGTILLLSFDDNPAHRKFLDAIQGALTDRFAPAQVVACTQEREFHSFLHTPFLQLLIASFQGAKPSFLESYRAKTVHQIEGKVLPLAPLDHYLTDARLKHSLWNVLKTHFLSPSSSTLPSTKP